jgi:hypothetical protein
MAWAFLRHSVTGGVHLVPEDSVPLFEARGWVRHAMPEGLDANDLRAPDSLDEVLALESLPEQILSEEEVADLKGAALEEALVNAGLSKSGTADEKRARLAEHEAELANTTEEEEVSNG